MEQNDVRPPNESWSYTGGISNIQDNKFALKMDISKEEFDQDIRLHPSMKKIWLEKGVEVHLLEGNQTLL